MTQTQTQVVMDNAAAIATAKANRQAVAVKLADSGLADAKVLQTVIVDAGVTLATKARDIAIERAKEFNGDESQIRDYLSGFRKGFEKSGDARASEMGVILRAYGKAPEQITGYTGGMVKLVELARSIAGKQNNSGSRSGGNHAPSDKGMASITGRIQAMKPAQAASIVEKGIAQIVATNPTDWELHLLRQIDSLTVKLEQSKQPIYNELARDLQELCADVLNRSAIDEATNKAAHDNNAGLPETVVTPQPAAFEPVDDEETQQKAA